LQVQRVAGANRFETAALAAESINAAPQTVLITSGMGFADAMSVAPAAAALRAPIILADGNQLPPASLTYLAGHPLAARIVVGGTASVGDAAAAAALSTERVAGDDRFGTSVAVAKRWFGGSDRLVVVTGSTFQDAAIAGPMAARLGGPVVMTAGPPTTSTYDFFRDRIRTLRDIRIVGTSDEVTPPTVSLLFA
jgi:putative cell wall-binding protein